MAQLLVRKLEPELVVRLKERARQEGITTEEAHRQILREALMGPSDAFRELLLSVPPATEQDEEDPFPRDKSMPRNLEL
jgi:plasmid stability protein